MVEPSADYLEEQMKKTRILCFGDSNTCGYIPNQGWLRNEHYPASQCWPGLLQKTLGAPYIVLVDAADSRTTNVDEGERNGLVCLPKALQQYAPINVLILALGGNDLKTYYQRTPEQIRDGIADLVALARRSNSKIDILLLSLIRPLLEVERYQDEAGISPFENCVARANEVNQYYRDYALRNECCFLNISEEVMPSAIDGAHLDQAGHARLAELVANKFRSMG